MTDLSLLSFFIIVFAVPFLVFFFTSRLGKGFLYSILIIWILFILHSFLIDESILEEAFKNSLLGRFSDRDSIFLGWVLGIIGTIPAWLIFVVLRRFLKNRK